MNEGRIIGVYKPKGPTSHDIVNIVRRVTGVKKVGHAGTLDPLASGVLVIAISRGATRQISEYVGKEKEYIADIRLGMISETDDAEGIDEGSKVDDDKLKKVLIEDIERVIKEFIGKIQQVPPIYSALKIKGKAAYKYARSGEDLKMEAREVEIKEIEILNYSPPNLKLRVITGPGVYIRSLARDIGRELGVGAYLAELERTRVGEFKIENVVKAEDIKIE
jgi:tRNA pseudouridine55 synthase